MAQPITIKGTVSDKSGSPIPGVNVVIKGTTTGTITDIDGKYSIDVSSNNDALVISFIGMKTHEISVGGQTEISVTMESDVIGLEEVIAIGYGTTSKKDLTGSVASVRVDNTPLVNLPNLGALQILQG
ncbi:MAG: carboxypeptidase-like regulatory domain-containing protein, partial [Bacteroidales bacterium]|nr:carboxypeptidase-like regulatory domain-containing protein [Bacteroidales bacterium]